jgi:hypothetical protein
MMPQIWLSEFRVLVLSMTRDVKRHRHNDAPS